jgi:hypothetical protein
MAVGEGRDAALLAVPEQGVGRQLQCHRFLWSAPLRRDRPPGSHAGSVRLGRSRLGVGAPHLVPVDRRHFLPEKIFVFALFFGK